jgi:hypothetical protein
MDKDDIKALIKLLEQFIARAPDVSIPMTEEEKRHYNPKGFDLILGPYGIMKTRPIIKSALDKLPRP